MKTNHVKKFYLLTAFVLFTFFSEAQVFVKFDATGNNDGSSWQNAFTNLDSAIYNTANGHIWVSKGTYKPSQVFSGSVYTSFAINKPISLFGGFSGIETNLNQRNVEQNATVLSGDIGAAGVDEDNTARVVWIYGTDLDSSTLIDGFIVTKAYYSSGSGFSYDNGGIYLSGTGSPVVRNCVVTGNVGFSGGGIYVASRDAVIINNTITNNTAFVGAGVFVSYSNAKILNNRIQGNSCVGGYSNLSGGGIYVDSYSETIISGNLIENNAADYGGGIAYKSNYAITISNNIISNNSSREGGGIFLDGTSADIIGNLIVNNYASQHGGGLWGNYVGGGVLVNNTIANNRSGIWAGAIYFATVNLKTVNNIIYNNSSYSGNPIVIDAGRTDWIPRFQYNDVQGGMLGITVGSNIEIDSVWRLGNFDQAPAFIDTSSYNFNLDSLSLCINKGNPDTGLLKLSVNDLSGNQRVFDGRIDLGCYEFSGSVNTAFLKVTPANIQLAGWRDSTINIDIRCNSNWNINNIPNWVNLNSLQGDGNATVSLVATANPNINNGRSAKLFVSGTDIKTPGIPVNLFQSSSAYLFSRPDTLYINGNADDSATFIVNSNLYWFFTSYPAWLRFNVYSGSSNKVVTAKATLNNTGNIRTGTITFQSYSTSPATERSMVVIQLLAPSKLCPGDSIQFSAGLSDSIYQWQLDSGSGFTSIQNGSNYAGTNTAMLKLVNIPSSFYGYKYRCLVGNSTSNIYSLLFENKWLGLISSEWGNPQNWSCGVLPDSNTDVVITSGIVLLNSNATVRKITIGKGVIFSVNPGFNLSVIH